MSIEVQRRAVVEALVETARTQMGGTPDRDRLDAVLKSLIALASHTEWWCTDAYKAPDDGSRQARYVVHEDPDGQYALYLNVMTQGKNSMPHDHTTWACIAGVKGEETNLLYARRDDGSREGFALIEQVGQVDVGPGTGVALMPDDIHAIRVVDDQEVRHLHFYGRAVEQLTGRKEYDPASNTCKLRGVGVKTRVAG
jgi:Predicted metal-dependent enzyme of the double-stranded beta helix superfamily